MGHWGEVPVSAPGWVCEEIVRHHLECPSLLCILSFQDWLSIDEEIRYPDVNAERINIPANPRHYWRYRMHLTLEELIKNKKFNEKPVSYTHLKTTTNGGRSVSSKWQSISQLTA